MSYEHDERELEMAALGLFAELGWKTYDATAEALPGDLGRDHPGEVILRHRLELAVARLNSDTDGRALAEAVDELMRLRPPGNEVRNNREVWNLLRDGAKVEVQSSEGRRSTVTVRFIDWDDVSNNDWLAVRQFKVAGDMYPTRTDVLGFVNGIPLVFVELKAPQVDHEDAYTSNLTHYRDAIPQLFWFNGVTLLSNGSETKVGAFSAPWDHFADWKRVESEDEAPSTSIETAIRGVCEPARLLDLVENFTLFQEGEGGLQKIMAKNHQVIGVNNALESLRGLGENQGRLGVFWHTQGSGKSFSMIFFAQKALRKVSGKYSFVVVTDRQDLDRQIYKNFVSTGAVTEPVRGDAGPQARDGEHLKELLRGDHRYVFTLIHKFQTDTGQTYPALSERDDIIVMVDEAHRTQYDTLALNMRNALPNAAFVAFTGTPLMAGEERTREVFGDYVSIYNFRQSIDDRATVPLYYENRAPEVQLVTSVEEFDQRVAEIADDLDEDQERRLSREFSREYHLITDDDRLNTVAADLVDHFIERGFQGKAMVISIDKATAVKMYDKVTAEWQRRLGALADEIGGATGEHREALEDKYAQMAATDMAVVVSASQNEVPELAAKGVDIVPHRKRMRDEDVEKRFKSPEDSLRMVFVCAMWLTGFDAPATSTIYLDKPMRNHTLMQTIARANRVFQGKQAGEIIDYVGVFADLQRALAIYGSGSGGGVAEGDLPVESKQAQADELVVLLQEIDAYASGLGVDLSEGLGVEGFNWVAWLADAAEKVLVTEDARRRFLAHADACAAKWRSVKPHPAATDSQALMSVVVRLAQRVRMEVGKPDISGVMQAVEQLLQESVDAVPFVIDPSEVTRVDLTTVDFDALAELFASGRRATAVVRLQTSIEDRLERMIRVNPTRLGYAERLQEAIDRYNQGSKNIEELFEDLKALAAELDEEEQRYIREDLTEEELAIFDLLTKPDPVLTKSQEAQVKKVVKELLAKLQGELLVLDWKNRQATVARVRVAIEEMLDDGLPEDAYDTAIFTTKSAKVFEHVYASPI